MPNYNLYKFYKGEMSNPFPVNSYAAMFWSYEAAFEEKFNKGKFTSEAWITNVMTESTKKEMQAVISSKTISKDDLFKVSLYSLLMEYLPDIHMPDDNKRYNDLYWATTSTSK